jgi:hypothetical protein
VLEHVYNWAVTMADAPVYLLLCSCGADVAFDDDERGFSVQCRCGRTYFAPLRKTGLERLFGQLRWAWIASRLPRRQPVVFGPHRYPAEALICCPLCAAVATPDQRWHCRYCYCRWNTFATRGRCPGCNFHFRATTCLTCNRLSRHDDWYARED